MIRGSDINHISSNKKPILVKRLAVRSTILIRSLRQPAGEDNAVGERIEPTSFIGRFRVSGTTYQSLSNHPYPLDTKQQYKSGDDHNNYEPHALQESKKDESTY